MLSYVGKFSFAEKLNKAAYNAKSYLRIEYFKM